MLVNLLIYNIYINKLIKVLTKGRLGTRYTHFRPSMPEIGRELGKDDEAAIVESVKAAGEIKMPLTGSVISVNESLEDEPELVNVDPEGDGWFMTISVQYPEEIEALMDENAYNEFLTGL